MKRGGKNDETLLTPAEVLDRVGATTRRKDSLPGGQSLWGSSQKSFKQVVSPIIGTEGDICLPELEVVSTT